MKCYYCQSLLNICINNYGSSFKCQHALCFANNNAMMMMRYYDDGNYYIPFISNSKNISGYVIGWGYSKKITIYILSVGHVNNNVAYREIKKDADVKELLNIICKVIKKYHRK